VSDLIAFGPGRYRFALSMKQICEIERLCGDKSIVTIYEELSAGIGLDRETEQARFLGTGAARVRDIYEVIRCAAIAGGESDAGPVSPIDAKQLVDDYVDGRPFVETAPVAWAILHEAIMGVRLKKKADAPESESPSDAVA
jgi:hypothetical protein